MDSILDTLSGLLATFRFPLDDPQQTLIATLVIVVAGLLVVAVLVALASPGSHRSRDREDEER